MNNDRFGDEDLLVHRDGTEEIEVTEEEVFNPDTKSNFETSFTIGEQNVVQKSRDQEDRESVLEELNNEDEPMLPSMDELTKKTPIQQKALMRNIFNKYFSGEHYNFVPLNEVFVYGMRVPEASGDEVVETLEKIGFSKLDEVHYGKQGRLAQLDPGNFNREFNKDSMGNYYMFRVHLPESTVPGAFGTIQPQQSPVKRQEQTILKKAKSGLGSVWQNIKDHLEGRKKK